MQAQCMLHRKSAQRFGDDAIAFLHRQFLECLVFQPLDLAALILIAHPAFETDIASSAEVLQLGARLERIHGWLRKAKAHQPPATGGMKTTESPNLNLCVQSQNSLLTATFNCSRE